MISDLIQPPMKLPNLCNLFAGARNCVAQTADSIFTVLYWRMERRTLDELLDGQVVHGEQTVSTPSPPMAGEYGNCHGLRRPGKIEQFGTTSVWFGCPRCTC